MSKMSSRHALHLIYFLLWWCV